MKKKVFENEKCQRNFKNIQNCKIKVIKIFKRVKSRNKNYVNYYRKVHKHQHLNNTEKFKREQRKGRKVIHGKNDSRKCYIT